jgi:hypothetical protein
MKKLIILSLVLFSAYSCIKKQAIKYDPELVGTWVANQDSVYTWLIINPDGIGSYSTRGNDEGDVNGEVKYSVFERKMWVDKKKFKVTVWHTGKLDRESAFTTKEKSTLKDTTYRIDKKMILESTGVFSGRSITFFRVMQ